MSVDFPSVRQAAPGGGHRYGHVINCRGCGVDDFLATKSSPWPQDQVRSHFQHRGWFISAKGDHRCRDCQKRERIAVRDARALARSTKIPMESAMSDKKPAAPAPSIDASDAFVDCVLLLKDHFDKAAKNYRAGWSDQRIASETGLSEKLVKDTREERFGRIVVDTLVDDARLFANKMGVATADHLRCAADLKTKLDAMQAEVGALLRSIDLTRGAIATFQDGLDARDKKAGA